MHSPSEPEQIVLAGGLVTPLPALQLLWRLEGAGFNLTVTDAGKLLVVPARQLTEQDITDIKANRDALVELARYTAPKCA